MKRNWWVICLCFFLASEVSADVVRLKSGKVVTGEIVEKTADYVKMKVEGLDLTYWTDEIEQVQTDAEKKLAEAMTPSDVYGFYAAALQKQDWAEMKKYLTRENIKEKEGQGKDGPSFSKMKKFIGKDTRIAKEVTMEDGVKLIVVGQTSEGRVKEWVYLKKEDGVWKINKQEWLPAGKNPPAQKTPSAH